MERGRKEIEDKLAKMGDYVRIDYLRRALTSPIDYDTKKFVLTKLAGIYEDKGMFAEAARHMKSSAEINSTFKDKIKDYMKAVELLVKGASYQEADTVFNQALALGNNSERQMMKDNFKQYYVVQSQVYVKKDQRSQAKKIFEKMLTLDLAAEERKNVQKELLKVYERLGNVREFMALKQNIGA